jgi:hypothetical protein
MIDLDRELRAMFDEDARHAPGTPDPGPAIRRGRRRQLGAVVVALFTIGVVVAGTVSGVSALLRVSPGEIPVTPPDEPGFVCPAGSTPDVPGPPGEGPAMDAAFLLSTTFDPETGRLLALEGSRLWAFDVCTNTWSTLPSTGAPKNLVDLVWDPGIDAPVALARKGAAIEVSVYEEDRGAWVERSTQRTVGEPEGFSGAPQAVYDPVAGVLIVRDPLTDSPVWTYDASADAWAVLETTGPHPPVGGTRPGGRWIHELLTYDPKTDRLVLFVSDLCDGGNGCAETWELDPRTGTWAGPFDTPYIGMGWVSSGGEMVYSAAVQGSILVGFGPGDVQTYEASTHTWLDVSDAMRPGPLALVGDDPVNERVLIAGSDPKADGTFTPTNDLWAFRPSTGAWTLLVPGGG